MDTSKIQIGLLDGKSNWSTWKYKLCILLRGIKGSLEVIEGKLKAPISLPEDATSTEKTRYEKDLSVLNQADNNAVLILNLSMTQETLEKVMRFTSAREVWLELHRLYHGNVEDKTYDLCMQFFSYVKQADDDKATHTSKLKNLWNKLQKDILKDKLTAGNECKCDLPEILLICEILETLPSDYFSFKSSWMFIPNKERTLDNLTNQLVAYEKALSSQIETKQEVSYTVNKRSNLSCKYCKSRGHKIKQCLKWKADGKSSKPDKTNRASDTNVQWG